MTLQKKGRVKYGHGHNCPCSFDKINRAVRSRLDKIKYDRQPVRSLRNGVIS